VSLRPADHAATRTAAPSASLTEVELTRIEGRYEQWIRFGRVATQRILSRRTRVVAFRSGTTFALVRWSSNDFGTIHSSIHIVTAVAADQPFTTLPFVRPGGDILLHITGWPKVREVLAAIDAVDAAGIDPCDASPDHWRHVGNRLTAGSAFRPYGADRHAAWLRRRAIGA
jgi:hypothetical protein